jgi:two-component system LytT family response regulator
MSESIRVLIVDDERLAREGVRALAAAEPDVQVVGECGDGEAAVTTLRRGGIDVLLLDVQMPGMDGFGVLRALPEESLPVVIFLKAFEAQALDYVVKPFSDERFRKAMERARRQVHQRRLGRATNELAALVSSLRSPSNVERSTSDVNRETGERRFLARIPVRSIGKVAYVKVSDIAWIGAADYYAELHTMDGKTHLVRESMQSLEERLDPAAFQRVHRSAIVNLEQVAEIRTDSAERQFVVLRDGTRLPLGRSRRDALEGALDRK